MLNKKLSLDQYIEMLDSEFKRIKKINITLEDNISKINKQRELREDSYTKPINY